MGLSLQAKAFSYLLDYASKEQLGGRAVQTPMATLHKVWLQLEFAY